MQELIKYWPAFLLLIATFLASIATFYSSRQDSIQKGQIQKYTELNNSLSKINNELGEKNQQLSQSILEISEINTELSKEIQNVTEQNLKISSENIKLSKQNNDISEKLVHLSETIRDLNTGGSSFPNFRHCNVTVYEDGAQAWGEKLHLFPIMYNNGEYVLDNLKIKGYSIDDYRNWDPHFLWVQLSTSGLNIHSRYANSRISDPPQFYEPVLDYSFDVLKPAQTQQLGPIRFKKFFEYFGINLFIETKRQDWIILLRFYRPKNSEDSYTFQAFRIMRMTGTGLEDVYINIDPGYPVNNQKEVMWFKSEMPTHWFTTR